VAALGVVNSLVYRVHPKVVVRNRRSFDEGYAVHARCLLRPSILPLSQSDNSLPFADAIASPRLVYVYRLIWADIFGMGVYIFINLCPYRCLLYHNIIFQ